MWGMENEDQRKTLFIAPGEYEFLAFAEDVKMGADKVIPAGTRLIDLYPNGMHCSQTVSEGEILLTIDHQPQ